MADAGGWTARVTAVIGVLAVVALAGCAVAMLRLTAIAENLFTGDDVIQRLVDAQIEAGYELPQLRPGDPLLEERVIVVTSDINERTAHDVVARLLYLAARDSRAPIDLYLSTQGGWTDSAFTIVDAMHLISPPVNVWAIGGCYSAGTVVLAAATGRRRVAPSSLLMVHANLDQPEEPGSWERLEEDRYEGLFRRYARLPEEWFPMTRDRSYYLSPEDAVRYGLADEVQPVSAGESASVPKEGATAP